MEGTQAAPRLNRHPHPTLHVPHLPHTSPHPAPRPILHLFLVPPLYLPHSQTPPSKPTISSCDIQTFGHPSNRQTPDTSAKAQAPVCWGNRKPSHRIGAEAEGIFGQSQRRGKEEWNAIYQAAISRIRLILAVSYTLLHWIFILTLQKRYFPFSANGRIEIQGSCGRSPKITATKNPSHPCCAHSSAHQELGSISPSLSLDWLCDEPWANNAVEVTFWDFWAQVLSGPAASAFSLLEP